jgi:hypothetical protein
MRLNMAISPMTVDGRTASERFERFECIPHSARPRLHSHDKARVLRRSAFF